MTGSVGQDQAEALALRALAWLLREDDLRGAFLDASGLVPSDLRHRAGEPEVLLAVVDFLLMDDRRVIAFCDAAGLPYTALQAARMALPGGADHHWT